MNDVENGHKNKIQVIKTRFFQLIEIILKYFLDFWSHEQRLPFKKNNNNEIEIWSLEQKSLDLLILRRR